MFWGCRLQRAFGAGSPRATRPSTLWMTFAGFCWTWIDTGLEAQLPAVDSLPLTPVDRVGGVLAALDALAALDSQRYIYKKSPDMDSLTLGTKCIKCRKCRPHASDNFEPPSLHSVHLAPFFQHAAARDAAVSESQELT